MVTSSWTEQPVFVPLFPLRSASWAQHWSVISLGNYDQLSVDMSVGSVQAHSQKLHNHKCTMYIVTSSTTFLFRGFFLRMSLCWFFVRMHACRPVGMRNHLNSVVCSGFEESIFDCQHMLGGDNCSSSVGIECSKATRYVVTITLLCVCVCVCLYSGTPL